MGEITIPFQQIISSTLNLASAISDFGRAILYALGIPEIITIGTYTINTSTVFSIILLVVTFFALIETSSKLLKYVLYGIIALFVLTIIGSVV